MSCHSVWRITVQESHSTATPGTGFVWDFYLCHSCVWHLGYVSALSSCLKTSCVTTVTRKQQSGNHLGFAEAFISLSCRPAEQILSSQLAISILRKVSPLEGIRSSINDSYCHPCNIYCGSSFYSLI